MPEGQTQAMHRQRLVLVLLALVLYRRAEVSLSRVVAWVMYRQRLVLELLGVSACVLQSMAYAHKSKLSFE